MANVQTSRTRGFAHPMENVDTSPPVADEVKNTTCYMCACRCGIRVHLKNGRIRYIDGNPRHPVNHGVICGKGSAGIMNQYSPARLRKPLLRIWRTRQWRLQGDRMGRGAGPRHRVAKCNPLHRTTQARPVHRSRSEPVLHRLVGEAVRHAEFRCTWWVLLGEHGGRRSVHRWWQFLGVRRP